MITFLIQNAFLAYHAVNRHDTLETLEQSTDGDFQPAPLPNIGLSPTDYISVIYLRSPESWQRRLAFFPASTLVSGTVTDGVFRDRIEFSQFSMSGTWKIYQVKLYDGMCGNNISVGESYLTDHGFPTELIVEEMSNASSGGDRSGSGSV